MNNILKKYLIPCDINNHHPIFIRINHLLIFLILVFLLNVTNLYLLNNNKSLATGISIEEIIEATNQKRIENGLTPLYRNHLLEKAAIEKLKDMLNKQYWSHYGPNGETPWSFILNAGYEYTYAGENLAKDFTNTKSLINAWMNSPTHRANILHEKYQEIGVGILSGQLHGKNTLLIAQIFGARNDFIPTTAQHNSNTATYSIESYQPTINKPLNNSYINNKFIDLQGESKLGNQVTIFLNQNVIAEIPINGGIFNHRITNNITEGINVIEVQAKDINRNILSMKSQPINVKVDITPPTISSKDLTLYQYKNKYILVIEQKEDISQIQIKEEESNKLKSLTLYSNYFFVPLETSQNFTIIVKDYANNTSSNLFKISDFQDQIKTEKEIPIYISNIIKDNQNNHNIFTIVAENISLNWIKYAGIAIVSVLSIIALIDAVIMIRNSKSRHYSSHHAFNVPIIVIAIILTIFAQ